MKKNFLNLTFEKCKSLFNDIYDIYIILDLEGKIYESKVSQKLREKKFSTNLNKKKIYDIISEESIPKIKNQFQLILNNNKHSSKLIEINHIKKGNNDSYPISYSIKKLDKNFIMMIGKDLLEISNIQKKLVKSQRQLEREYEKYKEFDTKYKVILNQTNDAIIIFEKDSGLIKDININAKKILKIEQKNKKIYNFLNLLKTKKNKNFKEEIFKHAKLNSELTIKTKKFKKLILKPMIFRSGNDLMILCQIEEYEKTKKNKNNFSEKISNFLNISPDSIVLISEKGMILNSNQSLLQICNITSFNDLEGKNFSEFLEKGMTDLRIICEETLKQGKIKNFQSRMLTTQGMPFDTNISTYMMNSQNKKIIVISIRLENNLEIKPFQNEQNNNDLKNLVGSASLKSLVSESSDVVEKICIQTALNMTKNNKVAAAELLEISRQSLYVKLEKYNLLEKKIIKKINF